MKVTEGSWHMREQCVYWTLSSCACVNSVCQALFPLPHTTAWERGQAQDGYLKQLYMYLQSKNGSQVDMFVQSIRLDLLCVRERLQLGGPLICVLAATEVPTIENSTNQCKGLHRVGSLNVKRRVNYVSIPHTLLITHRSSSSKYSVKGSSVKVTKTGAS